MRAGAGGRPGLAGLARPRVPAARPMASADPTVLGPAPAPLDCPYLHLDDDGPSCLALPPAIRLSRRQVEIVCAVAAHVACPRLIKADAGRLPVSVDPPARVVRRDRAAADAAAVPALGDGARRFARARGVRAGRAEPRRPLTRRRSPPPPPSRPRRPGPIDHPGHCDCRRPATPTMPGESRHRRRARRPGHRGRTERVGRP